jgi:hypothetical protein
MTNIKNPISKSRKLSGHLLNSFLLPGNLELALLEWFFENKSYRLRPMVSDPGQDVFATHLQDLLAQLCS